MTDRVVHTAEEQLANLYLMVKGSAFRGESQRVTLIELIIAQFPQEGFDEDYPYYDMLDSYRVEIEIAKELDAQ